MRRLYFQRLKAGMEEASRKSILERVTERSTRALESLTRLFEPVARALELVKGVVGWLVWIAFAFVGLWLIVYVCREVTRDVLVIDPISVPKRFEEAGLTSQVMANRLGDKLQEMERSTQTHLKKDVLAAQAAEIAVPEVEIPGTKLGLKTVVDVARSVLGTHAKHIGGDVVFADDAGTGIEEHRVKERVIVTAYFLQEQVGRQSLPGSVDDGDVPAIVQKLAELALRQVNPYVLAVYQRGQKKFDVAESIAEAMTQDASLDKEHRNAAFNLWGNALNDEGKHEEAIAKYAKAVEVDSKDAYGYYNWGVALSAEGKHEDANAKYAKAVKVGAKFAAAYNNWGIALDDGGKYKGAIAQYAKAVEIDPKFAVAYNNWGNALNEEGKYEEAIAKYAKAVEIDPKDADVYRNWGIALRKMGRDKEAAEKIAIAEGLEKPGK